MQHWLVPPQIDREEWLDAGRGSAAEVRRSLRDIRRINRYLGGHRIVVDETLRLLQARRMQRAVVLDVGSGLADIPLRLSETAARHGIALRVLALDNNARHLRAARETVAGAPKVLLLQGNAFRLPLADASVDVVTSSLFLHHFRAPQIQQLLREFERVSRIGWVMSDLVRHYVPLLFLKTTWPIFARSYLTRHDGIASIRRGYTLAEMRRIIAPFSNARVRGYFPYRMSVVGEKR